MPEISSGDILAGKYRVERVLGAGGMGFVVAATHIHLEQLVALKFIKHGALESDEAVLRFLREARAAVRLKSEHVARVFDVGTLDSGEPYMVMEYLEGQDLHAVSKRGQLPVIEVVEYVLQACEALAEAHSLGIVHRDIKPANLFLTRGRGGLPNIKVLDFGISRVAAVVETEAPPLEVTSANSILGSPRFMSPEQMLDPTKVDGRTDVWSLGVILYKLLTGTLPFESATLGGLLNKVMNQPLPPIRELRDDLPHALLTVIEKCMEKKPGNRYNVVELAQALLPFGPPRSKVSLEHIGQYLPLPEAQTQPALQALELQQSGVQPETSARPSASLGVTVGPQSRPRAEGSARTSSPPTGGTAAPWATVSHPPQRATPSSARTPVMVLIAGVVGVAVVAGLVRLNHARSETPISAEMAAPQHHNDVAAAPSPMPAPAPDATAVVIDPTPPGIDPASLPIAPALTKAEPASTPKNTRNGKPRLDRTGPKKLTRPGEPAAPTTEIPNSRD